MWRQAALKVLNARHPPDVLPGPTMWRVRPRHGGPTARQRKRNKWPAVTSAPARQQLHASVPRHECPGRWRVVRVNSVRQQFGVWQRAWRTVLGAARVQTMYVFANGEGSSASRHRLVRRGIELRAAGNQRVGTSACGVGTGAQAPCWAAASLWCECAVRRIACGAC